MGNGEGLVMAVKESVEELQQFDKNEEKFKRVIARLEEAFEAICDKVSVLLKGLYTCTCMYCTCTVGNMYMYVLYMYSR